MTFRPRLPSVGRPDENLPEVDGLLRNPSDGHSGYGNSLHRPSTFAVLRQRLERIPYAHQPKVAMQRHGYFAVRQKALANDGLAIERGLIVGLLDTQCNRGSQNHCASCTYDRMLVTGRAARQCSAQSDYSDFHANPRNCRLSRAGFFLTRLSLPNVRPRRAAASRNPCCAAVGGSRGCA